MPDLDSQVDHIEDDVLRLVFLCCHPSLTPESRAALTLRLVGGLTTAEIARGFLTTESTMRQRISRAKKTLTESRAEFELPTGEDRVRRLDDVMAVIYLVFNEGYSATAGEDWMRPELANEGMRLARLLADLAPDEPEVLGLQALLEIQGSRMPARLDDDGRAGAARGAGPVALGPAADQARPGGAAEGGGAGRARSAGRALLPAGLDRGAARPGRRAPRTPTGGGSRSCTTSWPRPHRDRSSRSTVPSRTGGRSTRARDWPSSRRSTRRRSATRRSSRASAATCSSARGCTPTPRRRSPRRRADAERRRAGRAAAACRGEPRPGEARVTD